LNRRKQERMNNEHQLQKEQKTNGILKDDDEATRDLCLCGRSRLAEERVQKLLSQLKFLKSQDG